MNHKTYLRQLKPISLITFDDRATWDEDGHFIHDNSIYDESDMLTKNDAILQYDENCARVSYKLGSASMINNNPTDNYSLLLGQYSYDASNDFPYVKSILEIPYRTALTLDKSFTVSFLFNKLMSDRTIMSAFIWNAPQNKYLPVGPSNGYVYENYFRTIFRKGAKISLTYVMPYAGQDYIAVVFPNNSVNIQSPNLQGFYNRDIYVNMTHDYIVMDDGRYYTVSRLYWDARIVYEYSTDPVYGTYDGGNTSPFEFGGNQSPYLMNSLNDRTTTPLTIDQIAIFDYALRDFQVADLYKKVYTYEDIITRSFPAMYYKFDESIPAQNFTDSITHDPKLAINYFGTSTQIQKEIPGVHGLYGGTMVRAYNKGMLYCKPYYSGYYSFFNPAGDFTIEFFASFIGIQKGMLFSLQDDIQPFRGISLQVNCRNGSQKSGSIQLSVTDADYIMTPEKDVRGADVQYNDDVLRHYVIRRSGNYVELLINAVSIGKIYLSTGSLSKNYNQLYMFGMMPGNLMLNGCIQHMAFYNRAIGNHEIDMRASYLIRYSINGRITVQGLGQRILIRVYSFNSGQLILESNSDSDGKYNIKIPSDDYINFVAMDLANINIRPRIVGPILPDEYEDLPWGYV